LPDAHAFGDHARGGTALRCLTASAAIARHGRRDRARCDPMLNSATAVEGRSAFVTRALFRHDLRSLRASRRSRRELPERRRFFERVRSTRCRFFDQ